MSEPKSAWYCVQMLVLPFYISLVLFTLPCPDAFYDLHPLPALIP